MTNDLLTYPQLVHVNTLLCVRALRMDTERIHIYLINAILAMVRTPQGASEHPRTFSFGLVSGRLPKGRQAVTIARNANFLQLCTYELCAFARMRMYCSSNSAHV